jgi:autotransporter family porin
MSQPINRSSVAAWVVAVMAAVVLVLGLVTGGTVPAIAQPEPDTVDGPGGTLPVGAALQSDGFCAAYANAFGSDREARPENTDANHSVPTNLKLPPWPGFWNSSANRLFVPRIDGQYTGTTDQIIVWGSCKWGIDTDVVRAMAIEESSWRQTHVGDYVDDPALCVGGYSVPCPTSFGILQLKHTTRPGSWPDSQEHTAFNVDYSLAVLRGCFEGWVTYLHNGYGAGDLWGCVGWHYSGEWKDNAALGYVQRVQRHLDERSWTQF